MQATVAFARPDVQVVLEVEVGLDASALDAIRISGILERFPEIDLTVNRIGIFGTLCGLDHPLRPGDRVEIYRPLLADPRDARRHRAKNR